MFLRTEYWLNLFTVRRVPVCYEMTWITNTAFTKRRKMEEKKVSLKCPAVTTLDLAFSRIVKINNSHNHTSICWRKWPELRKRSWSWQRPQWAAVRGLWWSTMWRLTSSNLLCIRSWKVSWPWLDHPATKEKDLGHQWSCTKDPKDIMRKLPDHYKKTCDGGTFLRHMEIVGIDRILMIFLSDYRKWILAKSVLQQDY